MAHRFQGPGVQAGTGTSRASAPAAGRTAGGGRELVQLFSLAVGVAFLLAGILGFVPGATTDFDQLELFGRDSEAKLLGLFQVSVLHNIVHLLFGVGVLAARRPDSARLYLVGGGVLYAGVLVFGLLVDKESDLNFLPINHADNLLHLGLSLGMIVLGLIGGALARRRA